MRFGSDNRIWFIFSLHIKSEMREITKKTIFQCIIEVIVRGTVKGRMSECNKVSVEEQGEAEQDRAPWLQRLLGEQ